MFTPTDEQMDTLARDDYAVASALMGVTTGYDEWDGRDLHRLAVAGLTGTPAFQAIIRAAKAEALREYALALADNPSVVAWGGAEYALDVHEWADMIEDGQDA